MSKRKSVQEAAPTSATPQDTRETPTALPILPIEFVDPTNDDGKIVEIVNRRHKQIQFNCGHEDATYFEISVFGLILKPSQTQTAFCGTCTLKEVGFENSIRCVLCGGAIVLNSGVTFYSSFTEPDKRTWKSPYVTIDGRRNWIGCLNIDCCPGGEFFGGHLVKGGIRTAFGGLSAAAFAMQTGKTVLVNI